MRWGRLRMLDETGIGLNLQQARQARADGLEPRFCRPLSEPVLARLADSGRVGRRTGGGFFDWPAEGARAPWAGLAAAFPLAAAQPDVETIKLRLLFAEEREALRCLEEGGIASADDAFDLASVLGLGFLEARRGRSALGGGLRAQSVRRPATASRARMASVSRPPPGCANSPPRERD